MTRPEQVQFLPAALNSPTHRGPTMSEMVKLTSVSPMLNLIDRAIEKGTDADQLDKLVQLAERMMATQALADYNRAMNLCQQEMPVIVKQKAGAKGKYAPLEDIVALITPCYCKHGFSLSFDTGDSPITDHIRIQCDVMHAGGHVVHRHLDLPVDGKESKGGMSAIQGHGSTVSYGRRYLTAMIFNLTVAGEDTDAAAASWRVTEEQRQELANLIDESGADEGKLLAWLNVESLVDVPARMFPDVKRRLEQKLGQKAGAK
jgi:hypothetical protein